MPLTHFICKTCHSKFHRSPSHAKKVYPRFCSWTCYLAQFTNAASRFWSKTIPGKNGCILWVGRTNGDGYGQFDVNGRTIGAHRYAFELKYGPVPEGKQIDHLCRVRHCVNPEHMEAVIQRVNIMRGEGIAATNKAKTHCKRGHALEGKNVYIVKQGKYRSRQCRQCVNDLRRPKRRKHALDNVRMS